MGCGRIVMAAKRGDCNTDIISRALHVMPRVRCGGRRATGGRPGVRVRPCYPACWICGNSSPAYATIQQTCPARDPRPPGGACRMRWICRPVFGLGPGGDSLVASHGGQRRSASRQPHVAWRRASPIVRSQLVSGPGRRRGGRGSTAIGCAFENRPDWRHARRAQGSAGAPAWRLC